MGKIERFWKTLWEEFLVRAQFDSFESAGERIRLWVKHYNHRRPHQALANRTPMTVWRDGVTGTLGERAVDMTLRLDNAGALPTCPQPQQQQKMIA